MMKMIRMFLEFNIRVSLVKNYHSFQYCSIFLVGRLGPCELGRDKLKIYKKFLDWVGEAESKMRLLGLTTTIEKKNSFVQSFGSRR